MKTEVESGCFGMIIYVELRDNVEVPGEMWYGNERGYYKLILTKLLKVKLL